MSASARPIPKSSSSFPTGQLIRANFVDLQYDESFTATATHELNENISGSLTLGQNLNQAEYRRYQVDGSNLIFGTEELDFVGPWEVLSMWARQWPDDGATVYAEYSGRMHFDTMTIYAAPLFHTGDERYAWLNRVQGVAKGSFPERGKLVYEIYELV